MDNPTKKPTRDELIALLHTSGWDLVGEKDAVKNRTLEELVRTTYERQKNGQTPGLIKRIETAFELDLIQLQELWEHLGLPM